jgi:hypothetical protein
MNHVLAKASRSLATATSAVIPITDDIRRIILTLGSANKIKYDLQHLTDQLQTLPDVQSRTAKRCWPSAFAYFVTPLILPAILNFECQF